MLSNIIRRRSIRAAAVAVMLVAGPAWAGTMYAGAVANVEVWTQGNVAFKLVGVSGTCANSDWFVINKSAGGARNLYAALLAARIAREEVRVWSVGCGPADDYGGGPYLQVNYLYLN